MKKYLKNVLIFILIVLTFNGVLFVFSIKFYHHGYYRLPDKKFKSFIFADSHGLPIRKSSEKFNVYNFSTGGDSYFDMKRKITHLIHKGYEIDTIFISVDDHTLSPYRVLKNNLDRSISYTTLNDYNNYYTLLKKKYIGYYLPIFEPKVGSLFSKFLTSNSSKNKTVWHQLSDQEKSKRVEQREKSQFPTKNKSEKLEQTLKEIISICEENKIELIGVKFPITNSYIKKMGENSYGADKMFLSKNLTVIDKKNFFNDQDNLFENEDHMNIKGGEIFTDNLFTNKTPLTTN